MKRRPQISLNTEGVSDLSIGDVMQIGPLTVERASQCNDADYYISEIGVLMMATYISCSHFVIAAESRLISQDSHGD